MVLPVVGDRCVPDKQVQAASVRVLFVGTSRLRGRAPSSGLAAGFVRLAFERSARCAGRLGDPRLGDKPLVSCWRVCVELARAWRSGARARMCTPPTHTHHTQRQSIVLARAISLACAHAARATNHPQHNAGPRIHDRCIPRIQVFRHVSDASQNQGTDGILNVRSFWAPSCRAPRQAHPPRPLLMKPRATVR